MDALAHASRDPRDARHLSEALYTFYAQHPQLPVSRPDEILPHFVRQGMPAVLRDLMLSAMVLASIDSPLGSLSAFDKILWLAFKIAGVTFGSLLGVFLPGLLSRRRAPTGRTCWRWSSWRW